MSSKGFLPVEETYCSRAITIGSEPEQWNSSCVVPPITTSAVFKQVKLGEPQDYLYGRYGNPSRMILEKCLANLEGAKYASCYASGVGAITTLMSTLHPGDHLIVGSDTYGGTYELVNRLSTHKGIEVSFVDTRELSNVKQAAKPNTKLIFLETPTNPTLRVTDLKPLADFAKSKNILTCVDNTFLTSYFQKPLNLGIDVVMYSATKYLSGHSDVTMGILLTNCDKLGVEFETLQYLEGNIPSPFECYLLHRSLKTLVLRLKQHQENGYAIANYLEKHPLVEGVIHPGLPSHPEYEITKKQTSGHSGMVCFFIKGANEAQAIKFLQALKLFVSAGSLGDIRSFAESPAFISHKQLSPEEKLKSGITDNCIRLSIGCESANDLKADLDQALQTAMKG